MLFAVAGKASRDDIIRRIAASLHSRDNVILSQSLEFLATIGAPMAVGGLDRAPLGDREGRGQCSLPRLISMLVNTQRFEMMRAEFFARCVAPFLALLGRFESRYAAASVPDAPLRGVPWLGESSFAAISVESPKGQAATALTRTDRRSAIDTQRYSATDIILEKTSMAQATVCGTAHVVPYRVRALCATHSIGGT